MPSPCAVAPCPNVRSSAANQGALARRIPTLVTARITALLGRKAVTDLDFEAVEMAARRQALRLAARALEQRLNADTSDHAGAELLCSCGKTGSVSRPSREDL